MAGLFLETGMDEEDAFYSLCTVVEDVLKGNYSSDMMATQVLAVHLSYVLATWRYSRRHLKGFTSGQ